MLSYIQKQNHRNTNIPTYLDQHIDDEKLEEVMICFTQVI